MKAIARGKFKGKVKRGKGEGGKGKSVMWKGGRGVEGKRGRGTF